MAKLHKREIEEFLAKLKGSIVKRGTGADEEDASAFPASVSGHC